MSAKICEHCSGSGIYVGWAGSPVYSTGGLISGGAVAINCKYCDGTGWIDEDELITITIQRKYIKDEYYQQ